MTDKEIFHIAAKNGWDVVVRKSGGMRCFDFQRRTLSGVPFCFTTEMKNGKVDNLVNEIISFVHAIDPATCAGEWMIKTGAVAPSRHLQAVADMTDIRTKAWLLACDLAKASGRRLFLSEPPWYRLN